jgi:hypothetical protein
MTELTRARPAGRRQHAAFIAPTTPAGDPQLSFHHDREAGTQAAEVELKVALSALIVNSVRES